MDTGCLGGGLDLGAGSARHAVGDVFRDGAAAQPAVLQDDGQATPEAVPGVLLEGQSVNGDRAALGCIESQQEGDQGGLAGPGGPHHGHHAAGGDVRAEVPQHRVGGVIAEVHMAEGDGAGELAWLPGARQVAILCRLVQQIQNPLRRGHGGLQVAEEFRRLPDRTGEFAGVQHKGGQRPQGQSAA
ncbi:Uncharacterised protein [uncultured Oscillibacter sp.]|nr:Uncharacterised protein [uncultured Oscillibacter sp.]